MEEHFLKSIVAYHTSTLHRIQQVYDALEFDLQHYLSQEQKIAAEINDLAKDLHRLTEEGNLSEEIVPVSLESQGDMTTTHLATQYIPQRYPRIDLVSPENLDDLAKTAEISLREQGIDPANDPVIQVLNAQQILDIAASYRQKYGDIGWEKADYVVVTLAGVLGAVMELLLVKLPGHSELVFTLPQGYAMTAWLKTHLQRVQDEYKPPFDALIAETSEPHAETPPMDLLWRFMTALFDIVRYSGTYVDEHGNIVVAKRLSPEAEQQHITTLLQLVFHILSSVFRSIEIQQPFGEIQTALTDPAYSWESMTDYARTHGYRPLLLLREGVVPAAIDLLVQGYWLLKHVAHQDLLHQTHLKLTSMLLLSHTLAVSGHLVKSGLIFQIDPLTLNWSQILRWIPLFLSWMNEGIEREQTIRGALDEEWRRLYQRTVSCFENPV